MLCIFTIVQHAVANLIFYNNNNVYIVVMNNYKTYLKGLFVICAILYVLNLEHTSLLGKQTLFTLT